MTASRPLPPLALALHQTPPDATWAPMAVGRGPLERILRGLIRRGYRFRRLDEVGPGGPKPGEALLTVDDGYASTAAVLAPLAKELDIPWSVFVLVGAVGGRNDWDVRGVVLPEQHLRLEEVRRLSEDGVGIGSHGMNHRDFTKLSDSSLRDELASSREWLEGAIGRRVDAVSYPWGRVDERVAGIARSTGYRLGFSLRAKAPARGRRRAAGNARGQGAGPCSPYDLALPRTALYAPDQIPGVFAATALLAPRLGGGLRDGAGAAGGWLVGRALASRGLPHA